MTPQLKALNDVEPDNVCGGVTGMKVGNLMLKMILGPVLQSFRERSSRRILNFVLTGVTHCNV